MRAHCLPVASLLRRSPPQTPRDQKLGCFIVCCGLPAPLFKGLVGWRSRDGRKAFKWGLTRELAFCSQGWTAAGFLLLWLAFYSAFKCLFATSSSLPQLIFYLAISSAIPSPAWPRHTIPSWISASPPLSLSYSGVAAAYYSGANKCEPTAISLYLWRGRGILSRRG